MACLPPVLLCAWLLIQARTAELRLLAAQVTVTRVRSDLPGSSARAQQDLVELREETGAARRATSGLWWSAAGSIPLAGRPFRTVHGIAVAADELAGRVLPQVMTLRQVMEPSLRGRAGGIDLQVLAAADPELGRIEGSLTQVRRGLDALPEGSSGLGRVDSARTHLTSEVVKLQQAAANGRKALELLVPALGGSGRRSYFLAFQTNAEARGTGGLVGAFGVVTADHGRISVHDLSSDDALTAAPTPVANLGDAFEERYGAAESSRMLANSNLSAHFPYAGQIWTGLWRWRTGQRLDGAIATDPVGLAQLLQAIGPVRLADGETLTAADAVAMTESTSYARYTDKTARKRFLVQVAQAVSEKLLRGGNDPLLLLRALDRLAADGRLHLWSADPNTQAALERTELAGIVPERPGPYAALVLNNSAGNKLDYYLDRQLRYELGPCVGNQRTSTVRIRLTDHAPTSGLPSYITLRSDDPTRPHAPGSTLVWVSLYASMGAQLWNAQLDGHPLLMSPSVERGHLVVSAEVELEPGRTSQLDLRLLEPASSAPPVVPVQPLVRPQTTEVLAAPCGVGRRPG